MSNNLLKNLGVKFHHLFTEQEYRFRDLTLACDILNLDIRDVVKIIQNPSGSRMIGNYLLRFDSDEANSKYLALLEMSICCLVKVDGDIWKANFYRSIDDCSKSEGIPSEDVRDFIDTNVVHISGRIFQSYDARDRMQPRWPERCKL